MRGLPKTDLVAIIGAGAMGAGIAQVAAQAGHQVIIFDAKDGAAQKARLEIQMRLNRLLKKEKTTRTEVLAVSSRLGVAQSLTDLRDAKLVVEAIVEDLEIKRSLFTSLEEVVSKDAILTTNTSSLSITAIAASLQHPERFAGMHFFNPAPVMKLVEIVSGLATCSKTLSLLSETAIAWNKEPVRARSTPGFIVNRIARPYYTEAMRLLEESVADAVTMDAIFKDAGSFRMGPFELMDMIGHDVNYAVSCSLFHAFYCDPRYRPSIIQQELVSAGWFGRKTGRGFYRYGPEATKPHPTNLIGNSLAGEVEIEGDLGPVEKLLELRNDAAPVLVRTPGKGYIRLQGATIALSDGRTATSRVAAGEPTDLVLLDHALDYATAPRLTIAKADQASDHALLESSGFFQAFGKKVSRVDDTPGLVLLRTMAMLINEAAEAVQVGVATPEDIDRAMRLGVNMPEGPFSLAASIGFGRVLSTLDALHTVYGDDRYRASTYLRRRASLAD